MFPNNFIHDVIDIDAAHLKQIISLSLSSLVYIISSNQYPGAILTVNQTIIHEVNKWPRRHVTVS